MDDLVDLLERTTPAISAPDVRGLTRRAAARRRRRRAFVVVPVIAVLAGAIVLRPIPGHRVTTANGARAIGTWRQTSPPPIDVTTQVRTVTLADGRVVVVAGSFDVDMPLHGFQSAIYDARTDRWTRLADAPVAPRAGGADLLAAKNGYVLVTHDDAFNVSLALLDARTLEWQAIPMPSGARHVFDGWAWDGTTLVLVRAGRDPEGATTGPPAIERWDANSRTWRPGAAPPTAPRFLPVIAASTHRLALWGGYTFDANAAGSVAMPANPSLGSSTGTTIVPVPVDWPNTGPRRAFTDGAIYDIRRDSWTSLPPEATLETMATRSAEGLLSDSTFTLLSSQIDNVPRIATRYEHGAWHPFPSPSVAGGGFMVQPGTGTLSVANANVSGPQSAQYLSASLDGWLDAPAYQLAQGAHGLLAMSATTDNPGKSAFAVWELDGSTWTPAVRAPFENRMEPGIGVTGDQLLVIGGQQGPNLAPEQDAWILDLTPSR